MNHNYKVLEFPAIIEKLKDHALSENAKTTLEALEPYMNEDICIRKMKETTSARQVLDSLGSPPLPIMKGLEETISLAVAGSMLTIEQLSGIAVFAGTCKRMTAYLKRGETINDRIGAYGRSIETLNELKEEIEQCINGDRLHDEASGLLKNVRRKKEHVEGQIKEKLNHILKSRKQYLADHYITNRQGHYVLPVKRKFQSQFGGTVIEASGKGSTVFMEPNAVSKIQAELSALIIEEENEVRRILYTLTGEVIEQASKIRHNMEAMEILDVLFAKAKLSAAMKASPVQIGGERKIDIKQGRHPLLEETTSVPLDFKMCEETQGVIITGPNTGGKTVAVKTVGLLSLMAQCGLHIPCEKESYIAMQDHFWCDIGDNQNISQNLSTFSGHMTNVIRILEGASRDSLVLLDELGSGTDPAEGMGIAVAVLEELRQRGCMFLVTTHYPQVKVYAEETDHIQSARMAFDRDSLKPLYKLEMGKAGESCALHIAKRLGLAEHLLDRAHQEVYGGAPKEIKSSMKAPKSGLSRHIPLKETDSVSEKFSIGDNVKVLPNEETAIVFRPADKMGDVIVQIKGEKIKVKHTRLRLSIPATELYPPDYDFSIIFDTVENRKARARMNKRYNPELTIHYDE